MLYFSRLDYKEYFGLSSIKLDLELLVWRLCQETMWNVIHNQSERMHKPNLHYTRIRNSEVTKQSTHCQESLGEI